MGKHENQWTREDRVLARMSQSEKDAFWAQSVEQRMAQLTYDVSQRRGIKRRAVVFGGATLLTTGYLALQGLVGLDQVTRSDRTRKEAESGRLTPTHLEILEECKDWFPARKGTRLPTESFITVGGLGCVDSQWHARPMAIEGLDIKNEKTTPMSYLVSSLKGKEIPEVANILVDAARESGSLSFYGQSNGSVVVLEALNYLKEKKGIVIPINRFVLNCSPFDFGDAQVNYIEEYLSKFLVGMSYEPGTIGQFLYLLRDNWTIDRSRLFDSFLDSVQKSWERAQEGEPPGPWIADLRILVNSRLQNHDFTDIITPETQMLFLQSNYDDVVFNNPAAGKYRRLAQRYGAKFTDETMGGRARHGDSEAGGRRAEGWFRRTGGQI